MPSSSKSLGADVVLPLTDGWLQAVKDHTGGRGVDLVVDPVGGEAFDDAIRALATEGRLLVIGFASGRRYPDRQGEPTAAAQCQSVVGVGYGEFVNRTPGATVSVRVRCGETRRGRPEAAASGAVPAVEGRRGPAEPGRRRGAREGRAGAVSDERLRGEQTMMPQALAFDVFGTVVDWRSSIIAELEIVRRKPWRSAGLADLRRQMAQGLSAGDGPGASR